MSTNQGEEKTPPDKSGVPSSADGTGKSPPTPQSVPPQTPTSKPSPSVPDGSDPLSEQTLPDGAFDNIDLDDDGRTLNMDGSASDAPPELDLSTMVEEVYDIQKTLPEGLFAPPVTPSLAPPIAAPAPPTAPAPAAPRSTGRQTTITESQWAASADKSPPSDSAKPSGDSVAGNASDAPNGDVEKTLLSDVPDSADEDYEKTMMSDVPDEPGDEDVEKTMMSDVPDPSGDDFDKTMMSDVPEPDVDEFDKTLSDGALAEATGDFDKTIQDDGFGSQGDDFDKTLPDGALAAATDDDEYGKTIQDGALDGEGDFDKTIMSDIEVQNDYSDPGKTMQSNEFDSAAAEPPSDDMTMAVPSPGRPKKDPLKTSVADTATTRAVKKSASKDELNVAPRGVSGLSFPERNVTDYRLMRQLGEGGMGIVYVAKQASLGREVVMKTLKPMAADQLTKLKSSGRHTAVVQHRTQMFLSEAVVTADLFHPNIVPIYDLGEAPDGSLFYTMKWVRGTPWNKRLKELSLEENLDVLLKVADAIAFAHARYIINRDLKPENVMLGEFGEVAVLDWGLALPFGEGKGRLPLEVTAGLGSGTPAYMAPELILGPLDKLGPGCDIYLLGAMLFESVTGLPPHEFDMGGSKTANQKMATIRKVVCENVIRPVEQKGELIDIALKALATKPEDRYLTVQELQVAIREYQRHAASRHLSDRAKELVVVKDDSGQSQAEQQGQGYAAFQGALALYAESLREWPSNQESRSGLTDAQLRFAQLALRKGDFDLGLSVLDTNAESHAETRTLLAKALDERESRVRRLKVFKIAASVMAIGLVVFLAVAARLQFNLTAAVALAETADKRAKEADEAFEKANIAKAEAEVAKAQAERDLKTANVKIDEADKQLAKADANLKTAATKLATADTEMKAVQKLAGELDVKAKKASADLRTAEADLKKTQDEFAAKQKEFEKELNVAEERTAKANYLAGLAEANRFVQEGRYSDARSRLERLKKDYADRCKTEWDQLWNTVNAAQAVSLHKPVESIGVSRDGRVLAATDNAGGIVVWAVNEAGRIVEETAQKFAFGSRPRTLVVSPDGKSLAVAGEKGIIEVRSLAGEPTRLLKGHEGPVNTVKFSADNRQLVSGSVDRTVRIWDIETAQELAQQKVLYSVTCVDWSRDGKILVAGTATNDESSGVAYSWSVNAQKDRLELHELRTFQVPPVGRVKQDRGVVAIALTEDGQFAASNGPAAELHLWQTDLSKSKLAKNTLKVNIKSIKLGSHSKRVERVRWLAFNPEGTRLLAAGDDGTISIWDRGELSDSLPTFSRSMVLYGHSGPVRGCATLPQSADLVVSGSYDQHVHVWNLKTYPDSRRWLDDPMKVKEEKPESSAAVLWPQPQTIPLRLEERPRWQFQLPSVESRITLVSQKDPTQKGATSERSPSVQIVTGHTDSVLSAVFSRDSRRVLSSSRDQTARVWDSETGRPVGTSTSKETVLDDNVFAEGHEYDLFAMRFFPGGDNLLTSGFDGVMRIWDARVNAEKSAGRELATLPETGMYGVVKISQDGKWILTAGRKNTAQLWNTQSVLKSRRPRPEIVLDGPHRFRVTAVAFSPDSQRLITTDREGLLVFWDRETGKILGRQRNTHSGEIVEAEFLGDGSQIITAGVDRRVVLWDVVESETGIALRKNRQFSHDAMVINMTVSPRGDRFFSVTRKNAKKPKGGKPTDSNESITKVALWDLETGKEQVLDLAKGSAAGADEEDRGRIPFPSWAADGILGLITTPDGRVHFVDSRTAQVTRSYQVENGDGEAHRAHPFAAIARPSELIPQHLITQTHNAAYLWRLKDGANLVSFRPQGPVFGASYSSDGQTIVTGGRSVRLFDAAENSPTYGRHLHKVEYPHLGIVTSVEFSPALGSQQFLTTSYDETAKVWEWQPAQKTVRLLHELHGHDGAVRYGTWSSDGSRVLTVGNDAKPRVWSFPADQPPQCTILEIGADQADPDQDLDQICAAFSWNGQFVAVGGRDVSTQESIGWIWDLLPGPGKAPILHATVRGHGLGGINAISFLPDDDRLLTGGTDGTARLWDWQKGEVLEPGKPAFAADFLISLIRPGEATTHRGSVTSVRITREGTIVTASSDGTVIIWPTSSKRPQIAM